MNHEKEPLILEDRSEKHEGCNYEKSGQTDAHEVYINPTVAPKSPSPRARTTRAFAIALGIWFAVVLVTLSVLPQIRCPMKILEKPINSVLQSNMPGGVQPVMGGEEMMMRSGREAMMMGVGSDMSLKQSGYKVVEDLPKKLIPQHGSYWGEKDDRRLIFIGDVHGSYRPLKELLKKIKFDREKDHFVLLGDMITRGRKSLEVLDFAMENKASCVRGNHEDRILLLRKQLKNKRGRNSKDLEATTNSKLKSELKLAKKLSEEQVAWLEACPVILNVKDVPGVGHLAAVHAGLRAGVPLDKQDPRQVMNMRSIDRETGIPIADKNGKHWATVWNHAQKPTRHPITVLYGHYAGAGLDLRKYSMGLDTDCNRGGKLTAFVVDASKDNGKIVQVDCKKLADKHVEDQS